MMAVKLMGLRSLPEDEIDEIRQLLDKNGISFYETPAGNWGISMPALWLTQKSDLKPVKALLDAYQQQRYERARAEFIKLKEQGDVDTVMDRIKQQPVKVFLYLAVLLLILYISTMPFLDFSQ